MESTGDSMGSLGYHGKSFMVSRTGSFWEETSSPKSYPKYLLGSIGIAWIHREWNTGEFGEWIGNIETKNGKWPRDFHWFQNEIEWLHPFWTRILLYVTCQWLIFAYKFQSIFLSIEACPTAQLPCIPVASVISLSNFKAISHCATLSQELMRAL